MGGAQSAQREDKEESGAAEDAQPEQPAGDESLKNNGQISEMGGKAGATVAEASSHCGDEAAAEDIVSPGEDASEAEKPLKEIEEKKKDDSPNEADANQEVTLETIDMDAKHNDINDSFRRLFSNINVKVTVKRGSAEKDDDTTKEAPPGPEGLDDTAKEDKSDNAEMNMALNTAQEPQDHDSTCPPLIKSEDALEEKTTESKEDNEGVHQDATPEGETVVSPVKRFFTTGIFSGLRKKKKSVDDTAEKELVDMRRAAAETAERRQDKETGPGAETETVLAPREENGLKDEVLSATSALTADEGKSTSTDPSATVVTEPEIISSQEKDKVQASPLKRLLSGSSFKKSSKKQRERKSSDAKLSDSGEYVSNQLPSSADMAENQKGESPAGDEDGAWASFKKLMTPKKRVKRSSMSNEETPTSGVAQESKSSEGEQMSDNSTEESKRRKDSSVSWEAVLCGSGRRKSRSRKTSDSEDEKPQEENDDRKKESPLESSNEIDNPKQEGSASEGEGSTWRSIKKLVTPKRKAKDEDLQSDGEAQDDSSFSIKKLLPGQKKRKPAEKQDYVSSDEADKEAASGDEDSETPAVVPLSEFETVDTGEAHVDVESHTSTGEDEELQQDLDQLTEPPPLCESLQSEAKQVQDNEAVLEKEAPADAALNEDSDEATESKHQQLSDIPEEGVITETMVTPGSVAEQPARDDTIAEDVTEITSEAITAPEPVDVTMADDTEMISAVSQLSDSSKTSGNTTPVPVEYDVNDTEVLLQQVAENISGSPEVDPLCSDEVSSERIVASVSCQILETFVRKQPTILEMHRRSDATAFKTGLNVKALDDIRELAATAQTESVAEVNEAVFTEIVSEVPTELDTAQSAVEDIHKVSVTQTEGSVRELESVDESQDRLKGPSEYEAASTENLSETEETVESSPVEERQETEPSRTEMQEEETKDGDVKQDVQALFEARDEITQTNLQAEHRDQSCAQLVQEPQPLERDASCSEEDVAEPPESRESEEIPVVQPRDVGAEKEDELREDAAPDTAAARPAEFDSDTSIQVCETQAALPEDVPAADEPRGQPQPFPEVHNDPEKEDELQTDADKTDHDRVSDTRQTFAALDSETLRDVQTPHSSQTAAEVTDRCTEQAEPLTQTGVELEKKEQAEAGEVAGVHTDTAADSQISSIQIIKQEELTSEETEPGKDVTDEPGGQAESQSKLNVDLELDTATELLVVQEGESRDSEKENIQTLERKVLLSAETVTDDQNGRPESLTQAKAEQGREGGPRADAAEAEHESERAEEQAAAPSQTGTTHTPEDIKAEDDGTDEPRVETQPANEAHVDPEKSNDRRADAVKSDHEQETAVVSESGSSQTPDEGDADDPNAEVNAATEIGDKFQAEDIAPGETVTEEPEKESEPVTEVKVKIEKTELQAEQEFERVEEQAAAPSQTGTTHTSEDIKAEDDGTVEPREETQPVNEAHVDPEKSDDRQADAVKSEQVSEISSGEQTLLDEQIDTIQIPEKETPLSEDIPPAETVPEEPEGESEPVTEVKMEIEMTEVQEDDVKAEQESERLEEQAAAPSETGTTHTPEDIKAEDDGTDEPREETQPVNEAHVDPQKSDDQQADAVKSKQVSEISSGEQTLLDEQTRTVQIPEKETPLSEDIPPAKTVTEEPEEESDPVTEVKMDIEMTEVQADDAKAEQESERLEEQAAAPSETGTTHTPEDIKAEDDGTDEPREETQPVNEAHVDSEKSDDQQADAVKSKQVSEVSSDEQDTLPDEQIGTIQIPEKETLLSEDIPPAETVTEEPEEEPEPATEVKMEIEMTEVQADDAKAEQVSEISRDKQDTLLDEQNGTIQTPEKVTPLSKDIHPETVTEEAEPVTEVRMEIEKTELQEGDAKPEHGHDSEVLAVSGADLDPRVRGIEIPEKGSSAELVTDEPQAHVEVEKKDQLQADVAETETFQVLETSGPGQAVELDSHIQFNETEGSLPENSEPETTAPDESREERQPVPEVHVEPEEKDVDTEHVPVSETEEDTSTSVSHTGNVQSPEKETDPDKTETSKDREPVTDVHVEPEEKQVSDTAEEHTSEPVSHMGSVQIPPLSEDFKPDEVVTDEPPEDSESEKENERHEDEHEQDANVLAAQEAARESEMADVQIPERNVQLSDDIQPTQTTERLSVITADDGRKPQVDASTDQGSLALDATQVPAADEEEGGVVEKGSTSEATVESQAPPEVNAEAKTEPVQEPEMVEQSVSQEGGVTSPKMEVTVSEDTRGTVEDEPTQAAEGNTELEEERTAGDDQGPCDATTEMVEQPLLQDLISPGVDDAPVRNEAGNEAGEEVNQDLEINKDRAAEISPHDVRAEQEESVPEVVGTLQTTSAVHVSSITEEKTRAPILDKTVISGKSPAPCPDQVRDTYQAKHEVHLSEVQDLQEREKEGELPGLEIKTCTVEHAVVATVTMCNLKEVSPAIPVVLTEKPSNVREPFIEVLVRELEMKKEAEIATPLVQSAATETAAESSVVVTMRVPSAEFGDNHRIQVQVVDVDIKSAETSVDPALEVGVTQTKEAVDVCHETIKVPETLSATEQTEEEPVTEEHTIIHHQVIHMKENLPAIEVVQTSSQEGAVNVERKQQPDETGMSEMAGNKLHEADQKATEAPYGSISRDVTTVAQQLVDTSDSPGSFSAIRDHKEDLEEDRREPKEDGAGVTAEEVKSPTGNANEEAQTKQSFLSQTVTVGNTGLDVPQNTGVISSIGNLESPSSLSLEFKLNIHFGQAKTPATERTEPVKHSNVSEVGIQAVEPLRPINGAHENHKKPDMHDVTVQATEITEPEHAHLNATERAVVIKQPVLLDIGIQSVEAAQPVEQIKSTERLNPSALETEKIKAVMQAETFLSQPVLYEACYEEIKVEEPVKQIEEENEQDLWVDAEEHIQTQEESLGSLKAEEEVAPQTESDEEGKAEREHEFEMAPEDAPKPETGEDGSQQEAQRTGEVCEADNEAEEFAAALEHPDTAKAAATD